MKILPRNIEGFLKAPDRAVRAVLVYGPDLGLVRERGQRLARAIAEDPSDPFRVADLSTTTLKESPTALVDELGALSFTGGRRLVRLRGAGNGEAKAIERALAVLPGGDSVLLVEGGDLGPRDALRKVFEEAGNGAALPCYSDEGQTLEALVRGVLGRSKLEIEAEAVAYLVQVLGADRELSRRELEKLALYKGAGSGMVTLADVQACIGDDAPLARDDVALATASGDQVALDRALARCYGAGETPIGILRAATRHFERLHRLALKIAAGAGIDQAIRSARPPIFFKHQAIVRGQLQQWRAEALLQALALLGEAEVGCKTTGMPAEAVCGRMLIRIAHAARRERR